MAKFQRLVVRRWAAARDLIRKAWPVAPPSVLQIRDAVDPGASTEWRTPLDNFRPPACDNAISAST